MRQIRWEVGAPESLALPTLLLSVHLHPHDALTKNNLSTVGHERFHMVGHIVAIDLGAVLTTVITESQLMAVIDEHRMLSRNGVPLILQHDIAIKRATN